MLNSNETRVFFELVKAGLWEKDARLSQYGKISYSSVLNLAEEQSVVGLVTAGMEHAQDEKIPQEDLLLFIGQCLQIEQRNLSMNAFIGDLIEKMRNEGIYAILVKGQGIAQCYERPLWRAAGDVDLLLSEGNYQKTRDFLSLIASKVNEENPYNKHLAMTIDTWSVELHGTLRGLLKSRIDRGIDQAQNDVFYGGNARSWMNGRTQVFLPGVDSDVIFVFSHILQHFFK